MARPAWIQSRRRRCRRSVLIAVAGQLSFDADGVVRRGWRLRRAGRPCAWRTSLPCSLPPGARPADVLKLTHFVVGLDGARLTTVRAVRDRYFDGAKPASSLVGVAALASPQALYEVEALAARGE